MTASTPAYRVVEIDAASGEQEAVGAWKRCRVDLPDSGADFLARYRWMYQSNPAAPATIYFLEHGTGREYVGFVTIAGRGFVHAGKDLIGGLLIDFVVHPKHRTAFPALLLQRQAHEAGMRGKALLYGIPDIKAIPIFKRLNCTFNLNIPRFVRVVGFGKYVARKLPAWLAAPAGALIGVADRLAVALASRGCVGEWLPSFDERFDHLWAAATKPGCVVGRRDAAFLRWRFGVNGPAMKIFAASSGRDSSLHTYFVGRVEADAFVVKDVFSSASGATLDAALNAFVAAVRGLGVNAISMSVLPDAELKRALAASRFIERDTRVCFWTLSPERAGELNGASWYLTPADEDM